VVNPPSNLLERFCQLREADDAEVLRFARKWGLLGLCADHGRPAGHLHGCVPADREPTDAWRKWADGAHQVWAFSSLLRRGLERTNAMRNALARGEEIWPQESPVSIDPNFHLRHDRDGNLRVDSSMDGVTAYGMTVGLLRLVGIPPANSEEPLLYVWGPRDEPDKVDSRNVALEVGRWLGWGGHVSVDFRWPLSGNADPTMELRAPTLFSALALGLAQAVAGTSLPPRPCKARCGRWINPKRLTERLCRECRGSKEYAAQRKRESRARQTKG